MYLDTHPKGKTDSADNNIYVQLYIYCNIKYYNIKNTPETI